MNSSQNKTSQVFNNKVAANLANVIIKVQIVCSNWLNQKFNACSTQGKKRLLIAIGFITSLFLIAGSFCSFYTIPKLSQNYSSAHIGMPSDMPKPTINEHQLTDSLTKTK